MNIPNKDSSLKEIGDYIIINLRKQGKKAEDHDTQFGVGACAYRGDNGTKCAAGWCIEDEQYNPKMEGNPVTDPHLFPMFAQFDNEKMDFLQQLQFIHDQHSVENWEGAWTNLYKRFGLGPTPEKET